MTIAGEMAAGAIPPLRRWMAVVILLLFYMLSLLDRQILPLLASSIQADLQLSDTQLGLLQGLAFALLYAVFGLFLGWAVDAFSRRLIIFWGVVCWSISCIAGGFASSFASLFLSRIGVGVGEATLTPGAFSLIRDLFPARTLGLAYGLFGVGGAMGIGISYGLSGNLVAIISDPHSIIAPLTASFAPWQATLIVAGAPGVILAGLVFLIPDRRSSMQAAAAGRIFAPLIACLRAQPRVYACNLIGFTLTGLCSNAVLAWTPVFMERRFGWGSLAIGNSLAVTLGIGVTAGSLIAGGIAGRRYARGRHDSFLTVQMACTLIAIPATCAAFFCWSAWLFLLLLLPIAFATGAIASLSTAALQLIAPDSMRGRIGALYMFASSVFALSSGPLIVGLLTDHLFMDRALVGASVALTVAVAGSASIVSLALAREPYRAVIRALQPA